MAMVMVLSPWVTRKPDWIHEVIISILWAPDEWEKGSRWAVALNCSPHCIKKLSGHSAGERSQWSHWGEETELQFKEADACAQRWERWVWREGGLANRCTTSSRRHLSELQSVPACDKIPWGWGWSLWQQYVHKFPEDTIPTTRVEGPCDAWIRTDFLGGYWLVTGLN